MPQFTPLSVVAQDLSSRLHSALTASARQICMKKKTLTSHDRPMQQRSPQSHRTSPRTSPCGYNRGSAKRQTQRNDAYEFVFNRELKLDSQHGWALSYSLLFMPPWRAFLLFFQSTINLRPTLDDRTWSISFTDVTALRVLRSATWTWQDSTEAVFPNTVQRSILFLRKREAFWWLIGYSWIISFMLTLTENSCAPDFNVGILRFLHSAFWMVITTRQQIPRWFPARSGR